MKIFKRIVIVCCLFLLVGLFLSCNKESNSELYLIKIDSIQLPNHIYTNTSFDISFFGTVGTNGCYRFSHLNAKKNNKEVLIEAWGIVDASSGICATVMVYLEGKKLSYLINEAGNYTIKIKQPDNSFLTESIVVE